MSVSQLAAATATFGAALTFNDASAATRQNAECFRQAIDDMTIEPSPANLQECKQWAAHHSTTSDMWLPALASYLVSLSASFQDDKLAAPKKSDISQKSSKPLFSIPKAKTAGFVKISKKLESAEDQSSAATAGPVSAQPPAKTRRVGVLHVVWELIKLPQFPGQEFATAVAPLLPELVRLATSYPKCDEHDSKINILLTAWEKEGYFAKEVISRLWAAAEEGPIQFQASFSGAGANSQQTKASAQGQIWVLPPIHGDYNVPWYEQPAGVWLAHMTPHSGKPIDPKMLQPIKLDAGLAPERLVDVVKGLIGTAERLFKKEGPRVDESVFMNEIGERIVVDKQSGNEIQRETWYGWSRDFSVKAMEHTRRLQETAELHKEQHVSQDDSRTSSRTRSRSRGPDGPSHTRKASRNHSRSRSRRHSHSRSRSQSRSRSLSRTRAAFKQSRRSPSSRSSMSGIRSQLNNASRGQKRRYSREYEPSRSRTPPRLRSHSRSASRSRPSSRHFEYGRRRQRSPVADQQDDGSQYHNKHSNQEQQQQQPGLFDFANSNMGGDSYNNSQFPETPAFPGMLLDVPFPPGALPFPLPLPGQQLPQFSPGAFFGPSNIPPWNMAAAAEAMMNQAAAAGVADVNSMAGWYGPVMAHQLAMSQGLGTMDFAAAQNEQQQQQQQQQWSGGGGGRGYGTSFRGRGRGRGFRARGGR